MNNKKQSSPCDPVENLQGRGSAARLADFIFEAGMLRKTPRTGYQFLGSGAENVAEHSFRTAIIGWALANKAGANPEHTAMLCLVHDFHEARTGDFNYVNSIYNTADNAKAVEHAVQGTGLEDAFLPLWREQDDCASLEARLAHDADKIDLICNLVEQRNLGNAYAAKWLESALLRVHTPEGKALAETLMATDHTDWWFKGPAPEWWIEKNGK